MSNTVIIAEDAFDPSEWTTHKEVGDVRDFLKSKFEVFPDTARIYHEYVSEAHDVTPGDEGGIERLGELEGTFYVIVYPGEPVTIALGLVALVSVVAVAVAVTATPDIPTPTERNVQTESPNNGLSDRQNTPRINGRIPDIYGTVRSTPDLIALPYTVYENDLEVEYSYMCIGVGEYDVSDIRDNETLVSEVLESTVEVYDPYESPKNATPSVQVGLDITEDLYSATKSNSVNGQSINPKGDVIVGSGNVEVDTATIAGRPDIEYLVRFNGEDLDDSFAANDTVTLSNFSFNFIANVANWATATVYQAGQVIKESGQAYKCAKAHTSTTFAFDNNIGNWEIISNTIDLSGDYILARLSPGGATMYFANLKPFNEDWLVVDSFVVRPTTLSPTVERNEWIGPFTMEAADLTAVYCNLFAQSGLYVDDGTDQTFLEVDVEVGLTPVDSSGVATASESIFTGSIVGSSVDKRSRGVTVKCNFGTQTTGYEGFFKARLRRTTAKFTQNGQIIDEVKWKDLYAMNEISETDFGNVTTVFARTVGTERALELKQRKLNMEVTRRVPARINGSNFDSPIATKRADEIIAAICLDPKIGNRTVDEIDFDNIYDTVQEVEDYFDTEKAVEFSYTFDNENLSFEETISSIAKAIHCVAYRQGNQIKINFEKETPNSVLLFNHRNKIPGSESRTVRFGNANEHDGVEFEYVDPATDLLETIYIPSDQSAINPKKVETIGIRDRLQAYFHSQRVWNKLRYQNLVTEFEATQESALVTLNDRVLVADNTRPDIQDGEVLEQNGLELTLSQDVDLTVHPSYSIFLQHIDGSVENISIVAGTNPNNVVLGQAPSQALVLDYESYARTTYLIVGSTEQAPNAFIVSEKSPQNNFTSIVRAVNYDARYYQNDKDFENGIVDGEGNII